MRPFPFGNFLTELKDRAELVEDSAAPEECDDNDILRYEIFSLLKRFRRFEHNFKTSLAWSFVLL